MAHEAEIGVPVAQTRMLDLSRKPIDGLFAAVPCASGVFHGFYAGTIAVAGITGRWAGMSAAKNLQHRGRPFSGREGRGRRLRFVYYLYEEMGPATEATSHADVLDLASNGMSAVGRLVIQNWHGCNFVDYFEFMKVDGEWKIVAKIYNQF